MKATGLLLLAGCHADFTVNRQDLGPFRIAAVGVVDGRAAAAVWSGLDLYTQQEPRCLSAPISKSS